MKEKKREFISWCIFYCKLKGISLEEMIWNQDEIQYDYEHFLVENKLESGENSAIEFLSNYEYEIELN